MFVDENKLTPEAIKHLQIEVPINDQQEEMVVELRPYKMIKEFVKWLVSSTQQGKIWAS